MADDKFVKKFKPISDAERDRVTTAILAEYERLGKPPVYAGDMLVSPGLAETIRGR
ncbi:MAG TPA: hypothetical protein VNU68_11270 [Verrucomicrobiae bacterium]|nr:hypothetical protein [Verrucomicrobiae bacterium]